MYVESTCVGIPTTIPRNIHPCPWMKTKGYGDSVQMEWELVKARYNGQQILRVMESDDDEEEEEEEEEEVVK